MGSVGMGWPAMEPVKDLVEDWIAMRSTLVRQVEKLKSSELPAEPRTVEVTAEATIIRVEVCIRELNALLKEYARA